MAEPVIFLAFANQSQNPLPLLSEEAEVVHDAFASLPNADDFVIYRNQEITSDTLLKNLGRYPNRISIFHFAGHAATSHLFLADQPVAGHGLNQILALQRPLHLVFLNGCNTSGFIKALLGSGVPAVVATTRSVEDPVAVALARHFYTALAAGSPIGEAFAFAKGALEGNDSVPPDQIARRGLILPEQAQSEFPWGLYYRDEQALSWNIANAPADISPVPGRFWLRLAVLIAIIGIAQLWAGIHLGKDNLMAYLSAGPFLVLGLAASLIKLSQRRFPGVSDFVNKPLAPLIGFLFDWRVLGTLSGILFVLILSISSVRIRHPEETSLNPVLTTRMDEQIGDWQIAGESDITRIVTLAFPGTRQTLRIEGFEDTAIVYPVFTGVELNLKQFARLPVVVLRLPHDSFNISDHFEIKVNRNRAPYLASQKFNDRVSVALGRHDAVVSDTMKHDWGKALLNKFIQMSQAEGISPDISTIQAVVDHAVERWSAYTRPDGLPALHYRDTLDITLHLDGTPGIHKSIVITKPFTDVLLN